MDGWAAALMGAKGHTPALPHLPALSLSPPPVPHPGRLVIGQLPIRHRPRIQDGVKDADAHVLVVPPGHARPGQQLPLKDVGKRAVPQVVAQAGKGGGFDVPPVHLHLPALQAEHPLRGLPGQVGDAQGVLKPVVAGARKDVVGDAQLFQVAQALEGGGVDDRALQGGQVKVAVDGVVEDLWKEKRERAGGGA